VCKEAKSAEPDKNFSDIGYLGGALYDVVPTTTPYVPPLLPSDNLPT
jgi:hypothetical protein